MEILLAGSTVLGTVIVLGFLAAGFFRRGNVRATAARQFQISEFQISAVSPGTAFPQAARELTMLERPRAQGQWQRGRGREETLRGEHELRSDSSWLASARVSFVGAQTGVAALLVRHWVMRCNRVSGTPIGRLACPGCGASVARQSADRSACTTKTNK